MDYLLHIFVVATIFAILAMSLDLLAGHTGLLSFAQAAFWGIGAYASGLLVVGFGMPFFVGLLAGVSCAVLISFIIAFPSLRLRDDYFVIATFSFQIISLGVFNNWTTVTRGPLGISGITKPSILGLTIQSQMDFAVLALVLAGFSYLVIDRITSSPFGRVLHGIREDEDFTRSLGKNTLTFKIGVFAISAALSALAGSLYAHYVSYVDPTSFTVMESLLIVSMVVIGGAGSRVGAIFGAVVLVILPEALRFIGLSSAVASNLRQIIYGALLVTMMLFRPRGLVGKYGFGR